MRMLLAALAALIALAQPVSAQCELSLAEATMEARKLGFTARSLPADEVRQVQTWYNALPPETDFVLSAVIVYTHEDGYSVILLVVDGDCVIASGRMTYDALMARVRGFHQNTLMRSLDLLGEVFVEINARGGIAAIGR